MGKLFATVPEIMKELRVSRRVLVESGVLEGCRRIPAGQLGRVELYLWADVVRAALALGEPANGRHPAAVLLDDDAFERIA
jgi:hypothetical protein